MVNNTGRIVSPDGYDGGILGINYTGDGAITNCYNTGEVFGDTAGGILAIYIGGIIKNCYNTGDLNYSYYIMGGIIGSDLDGSAFDNTTNCYYLDTSCTNDSTTPEECDVKIKTVDQFESGEVAYLLQSEQEEAIWGQKIGTDKYPVFGGDSVYAIFESCISNPKYTNNASEVTEIPHKYENGFCTICSKIGRAHV